MNGPNKKILWTEIMKKRVRKFLETRKEIWTKSRKRDSTRDERLSLTVSYCYRSEAT